MNIERTVQVALLGEVPSTLRFLYVSLNDKRLSFHAVFSDDAIEDHLESASCVLTEVVAACPMGIEVCESIEIDGDRPWKINGGENLMYLRYGELENA